MAETTQTLPPIILETADTVRARFDSDATAGIDPSDSRFVDLTVGGMYYVLTQPGVLECVRLWDAITEMIAAMLPQYSWGEFLDSHGATIGVTRKDEVKASGELLFTGAPGTLIPAGTKVSTIVSDPSSDQDAQEFETVDSITLAVVPGPTSLVADPSGSGGTIPAGIYYYRVTALDTNGVETIASNEAVVVLSGATSSVDFTWTEVAGATGYRIYRGQIVNGESFLDSVDLTNVLTTNEQGAETDASGWSSRTNTTVASSSSAAQAGTKSVRMTAVAAGDMAIQTVAKTGINPGEVFNGSVYLKAATVAQSVKVGIVWLTSADAEIGTPVYGTAVNDATSGFTQVTVTATAPATAAKAKLIAYVTGAALGEQHYMDTAALQLHPAAYTDDGTGIPTTDKVPTNRAPAVALQVGAAANVPVGTIILVSSPIEGGPAVTNPEAFAGGADVESDDQFSKRIRLAYLTPKGGGVQADYERYALSFPEVGFATVEPVWAGAGTVRVVVTDQSNNPVSAVTIQQLQDYLDPIPGAGAGVAPIGAIVTVATPTVVTVTSSATITFKDGYSLDGIGGVVAQRDAITTAIQTYLNGLRPGDDAILNKVIGQIMLVPGVLDVSTVHLNGAGSNVTITALQVAQAGAVTLS